MDTYTLLSLLAGTLITLLVGVGTAFWTNRRLTSARQERQRSIHREMIQALARYVTESNHSPDARVVLAIARSKAIEQRIGLPTPEDIAWLLDGVVTRFAESELVSPQDKITLIDDVLRLQVAVRTPEQVRLPIPQIMPVEPRRVSERTSMWYVLPATALAATVAGLLVTIVSSVSGTSSESLIWSIFLTILLVSSSVAAMTYMRWLRRSRMEEAEFQRRLAPILEDMITSVVSQIFPDARIDRQAKLKADQAEIEVDFILNMHGMRIPIEIKYGKVGQVSLDALSRSMKALSAKHGILVTTTPATDRMKAMARELGIILLDAITSERDIIERLLRSEIA